jgi:hypothetical protein
MCNVSLKKQYKVINRYVVGLSQIIIMISLLESGTNADLKSEFGSVCDILDFIMFVQKPTCSEKSHILMSSLA